MLPLTLNPVNSETCIKRVSGNKEIVKQLANMGFISGSKVKVISNQEGNLIVEVKNCRYALDHKLASKIMTEIV